MALSGYIRVSQVGGREGDGFISPEVQEKAIRDWGERHDAEILIEPHELNVSGGTMDRPVFNSIMDKIRAGKSEGIVVYKLDRFSRSLLGALTVLSELGELKASFASATEPELDYSSPAGRAFLQQMFVFAEFTRSTLKESWATAQRSAIERGIHISPSDYLGYDRGDDRRLIPNDLAPVVAEVFQRRGEGESWRSLADFLNEVAPRDEGKLWNGQAVQRLCSKRVYLGEASRYVDQDIDGRGPIVNSDAHPAIVTPPEFEAAQMDPRAAWGGDSDKPSPLLSGLIRCSGCRYSMSIGRSPKGEQMYRCRKAHASGECPEPAMIMAPTIEDYVEGTILEHIDGIAKFKPASGDRDRLLGEVAQERAAYDDFRRDREARRKMGPEDWQDTLDIYLGALRAAEARLEEFDRQAGAVREGLTRDIYLSLPVDDRRQVIAGFIDTVMIRRSRGRGRNVDPVERRARILWRGEGPDDLPRRRVVNEIRSFVFGEHDVEPGVASPENGA
jgi:DNA invertase Pin-like site-specific DNA recombinase